jgi:hypothetical protein
MSDDLIKRLREADSYNKKYYALDPLHNEAADRIEQLEAKLAKAVTGLKPLVQICEMMRDGSGFCKGLYQHEVTDSQWSPWCKQIKNARTVLAELEGKE